MPRITIAFDLDGTLVDTAPDLIDTLNIVLGREGIPPVPHEQARLSIGGGARAMISRGLTENRRQILPAQLDRLFTDFIAHYSAHIADRSRPFPGVERVLEQLAAKDFILAVCTNKLEGLSRQLLKTLGLAGYFTAICGQDTFAVQKPDPSILIRTIAAVGGNTSAAIMVGDSATDVLTARAADIAVIGVDFGYTERPISDFQPDHVIGHFDDLEDAIARIINGA